MYFGGRQSTRLADSLQDRLWYVLAQPRIEIASPEELMETLVYTSEPLILCTKSRHKKINSTTPAGLFNVMGLEY